MARLSLPAMRYVTVTLVVVVVIVVYWSQSTGPVVPVASPSTKYILEHDGTVYSNFSSNVSASTLLGKSTNSPSPNETTKPFSAPPPATEVPLWWKNMSARVCPNMMPRTNVAHKLFPLARMELRNISVKEFPTMNVSAIQLEREPNRDMFSHEFYAWSRSWEGMSRMSDGPVPGIFSMPKMWKVANNQLDGYWSQVFENIPPDASSAQIEAIRKRRGHFENRLYPFRQNGPQDAKECIVIVVRDPINHFLSAYNEVQFRIETYHESKREALGTWPSGAFEAATPERFQQFLIDVLSWPITRKFKGVKSAYPQNLELQHMFSMSGVLVLLARERSKYRNLEREIHVLPTIQNMEETLGPYILESCPDSFGASVRAKILATTMNTTLGEHPTSRDPVGSYAASKQVFHGGGPFARALCAMHLMDYACWLDLPDGVPEICMELYREYHEKGVL